MLRAPTMLILSVLLAACPAGDDPASDAVEGNAAGECDDTADNDSDGLLDCADPDCAGAPNCASSDDDDVTGDDDDTAGDDDTGDDDTGDDDTGDDDDATGLPAPTEGFIQVAVGRTHSCALEVDGEISCWGNNDEGQTAAPGGSYTQVSVGHDVSCALGTSGTATCWGELDVGQTNNDLQPPNTAFEVIRLSEQEACGLTSDGDIECWARDSGPLGNYQADFVDFAIHGGNSARVCGLGPSGGISCYGATTAAPPSGAFVALDVGLRGACAIASDNSVHCWDCVGDSAPDLCEPTAGTAWVDVAVGQDSVCGIRASDNSVECFGCGVGFGNNNNGQCDPPTGAFYSISAGNQYNCGVRPDGSIACWGLNDDGQSTPP